MTAGDSDRHATCPRCDREGVGSVTAPVDMSDDEPLTEGEVEALADGTPVAVIWSGGNGPHDYVIAVDEHGSRYVWNGTEERLRYYNPLRFVGQERYHTRVWLATCPRCEQKARTA